ncbi:carboxymuconolactone decarboxylase family protein [Dietzia sp.]|uniref:carboxymuconolactone decarboxylase family protein n=1 Tax=Dietzia sp. TaxID=1871616 RepID=UPI002FDA5CE2
MHKPQPTATNDEQSAPRVAPGKGLELSLLALLASKIGSRVTGTDDVRLFSTLGRVRRLFPAWLVYSGMMMPFGVLSRKETELVILRVSFRRGSTYERNHHEGLGSRIGLSDAEISRTKEDPAAADWDPRTKALLTATDEILDDKDISPATWETLAAHLGERELVAFVLLVNQYDGLATTLHTLRVQTDRKS